jgi:hypothetical protein
LGNFPEQLGRKQQISDYQRKEAFKRRAVAETFSAEIAKNYAVDLSMISGRAALGPAPAVAEQRSIAKPRLRPSVGSRERSFGLSERPLFRGHFNSRSCNQSPKLVHEDSSSVSSGNPLPELNAERRDDPEGERSDLHGFRFRSIANC